MASSSGLPARGGNSDVARPADPLGKGRFAEGRNVNPDNLLENVIMKSPDMTQTNKVAMSRGKRPLKNQKLKGKQKGLTMVEYAIAGTLVTVAAATAFTALGQEIATAIGTLITNMGGTPPA